MIFQTEINKIITRKDYHDFVERCDTVTVNITKKRLDYIPETRIIGWRKNGAAIHQLQKNIMFIFNGYIIFIPAGFVFDGASIPKLAWSIVGAADGRYFLAALIHDWLYTTKQLSKEQADDLFKRIMMHLGISWFKRVTMWRAVDWFGGSAWRSDDRAVALWMYSDGFKYSPWGGYVNETLAVNKSFDLVPPKQILTNDYQEFKSICIKKAKE